jgi:microcystin-dependent protein
MYCVKKKNQEGDGKMSDNFVGEIRPFAFGLIPQGWLPCDGRVLQIQGNQALYSLLGTTFGGNGTSNFALPDLRGRCIIHPDVRTTPLPTKQGTTGGTETVTLTTANMPPHLHTLNAAPPPSPPNSQGTLQCITGTATQATPVNNVNAGIDARSAKARFNGSVPDAQMQAGSITLSGTTDSAGGAPHDNMSPFLVINYCIATMGVYPPRS